MQRAPEELDPLTDELEELAVEEDSATDELDDLTTEEERGTEELDCAFAPELETTTDELDPFTEELEELTAGDEFTCPPLEYISAEDELSPSGSVPLFPLSPSHAAKISATTAMHNNATRCFCFICRLPLAVNHWLF
jgi:hypothetical protein